MGWYEPAGLRTKQFEIDADDVAGFHGSVIGLVAQLEPEIFASKSPSIQTLDECIVARLLKSESDPVFAAGTVALSQVALRKFEAKAPADSAAVSAFLSAAEQIWVSTYVVRRLAISSVFVAALGDALVANNSSKPTHVARSWNLSPS